MDKQQELRQPDSCLNKAAHDEPVFVLRAKDPLAAQAVSLWAAMAHGVHEDKKVQEAVALAKRMDDWRNRNVAEATPLPTVEGWPSYLTDKPVRYR